jgi:hypothetical protein
MKSHRILDGSGMIFALLQDLAKIYRGEDSSSRLRVHTAMVEKELLCLSLLPGLGG